MFVFRLSFFKPLFRWRRARSAFTLVELLVVIAIIGILVGLLMPAMSAARESGRRAQCANNLSQLGKACMAHAEAHGYYPSGGWGRQWVGDPTLGYGKTQPGSWLYSILPGLEQQALHDLGGSVLIPGKNPPQYSTNSTQLQGAAQCIGTPLPIMNCPSRRRAVTYRVSATNNLPTIVTTLNGQPALKPINSNAANMVARGDYACNFGDKGDDNFMSITSIGAANSKGTGLWYAANSFLPQSTGANDPDGVIYVGSQIRPEDVTDGLTNTYLLGEKYLNPDNYATGADWSDNQCMYSGSDNDNQRSTHDGPPVQDRAGLPSPGSGEDAPPSFSFGSAHVGGCCFVFCDGSTHWINYSIDPKIHNYLGNRNDANPIDVSKL